MKTWVVVGLSLLVGGILGVGGTLAEFGTETINLPQLTSAQTPRIFPDGPRKARPRRTPSTKKSNELEFEPLDAPQPKVQIESKVHDFGELEVGQKDRHTFVLRNVGQGTLRMRKGFSSCKCTKIEGIREEVLPGETAEITVEWSTVNAKDFSQRVEVHTNDRLLENHMFKLIIKGVVRPILGFDPRAIYLPNLAAGESHEMTVNLYYYRDHNFLITKYFLGNHLTRDLFTVDVEPLKPEQFEDKRAYRGYRFRIRTVDNMPIGVTEQKLVVQTNVPFKRLKPVTIYATVKEAISLKVPFRGFTEWNGGEQRLSLNQPEASQPPFGKLLLSAIGSQRNDMQYSVKEVVPKSMEVTLGEKRVKSRGRVIETPLTVTLPKSDDPLALFESLPDHKGYIVLETNHPDHETIKITVDLSDKVTGAVKSLSSSAAEPAAE